MDKKQLQDNILSKPYKREVWHEVLKQVFGVRTLFNPPRTVPLAANEIAKDAVELGNFYTADERLVGIYEITLRKDARTKLAFNKVGLRNLLRSIYKYDVDGALIVFVQEHKWRFSYVSEIRTEEGKKETEPKRYTYLFGEGESSRTAADRFYKLIGKPIFLNDLYDAFSVEKLNKDFFKTYKEFYEKGVAYLADNKTYYKLLIDKKQTEEDKKQKPIRDFVKKLLGRIVFLHFLQKKGWMGCPLLKTQKENDEIWLEGKHNFMSLLFKTFGNKQHFHSTCLKTLFFETLNTKRKNNIFSILLPNESDGKPELRRVPYLNGGLFDKDISFEHEFDFPVDYFEKLFDFFEQYNFTIDENDPYDSEVGIDPEMLGHIFENLLEENRERGAFYTPKEIVHYMCQESLIEYLHTQLTNISLKDIQHLIRNNRVSDKLAEHKNATALNSKLKSLKICDPAIGSGAFPMGTLREVFECRRLIYPYLKTNESFKPALVKKEIIQENIYGVDIEPGAVDIARLRFWLALVVDETKPHPLPNLDYKIMQGNSLLESFDGIDLSHVAKADLKIVEPQRNLFGDLTESQLKVTFTQSETIEEIQKLMHEFFELENPVEKQERRNRINAFVHRHIEFNIELRLKQLQRWIAEIQAENNINAKQEKKLKDYHQQVKELEHSQEQLYEVENIEAKPFFLWHLFFADVFNEKATSKGFDIVIGNPPYIQLQKMGKDAEPLEKAGYKTYTKTGDIYCLFYEKGNELLKTGGILSYITSNSWLKTKYGHLLRKYLSEETNPTKLLNFEDTKVFQTATVETNIFFYKKEPYTNSLNAVAIRADYSIGTSLNDYFVSNSIILNELEEDGWIIADRQSYQIKKQIEASARKLGSWELEISRGIVTGFNEAFVITTDEKNNIIKDDPKAEHLIKKFVGGRDIQKYSLLWNNEWLIYSHSEVKESDYPSIINHLKKFRGKLKERRGGMNTKTMEVPYQWWQLQVDYFSSGTYKNYDKPKLMWAELSDKQKFFFDDQAFYPNKTIFIITGDNLKYLLAILNSKAIAWYFDQISTTSGMGTTIWSKYKVELLPVPILENMESLKKFEILADYLIYLNTQGSKSVNPYTTNMSIAPTFESVLDMMVYELYFMQHLKDLEIDVLQFIDIETVFKSISDLKDDGEKAEIIGNVYKWLQQQDNPIRNRIILSNIKSPDIIRRINSTTH